MIVHSELLLQYLKSHYPELYPVSSTTKVLTDFEALKKETDRDDFRYVVPDFRLNKAYEKLNMLTEPQKEKVEFLCNECCYFGCKDRKECYEAVSRRNLGEEPDFSCTSPGAEEGYRFSKAMKNPGFISVEDIQKIYLPMGFPIIRSRAGDWAVHWFWNFTVLYDETGVPAAGQRRNLSGQYAGSVLINEIKR